MAAKKVQPDTTPTPEPQPDALVQIAKIDAETLLVPIVGTAPLIVHNFSEKSKRQMLEAQQGKKKVKEVRDPVAEYEAAFYRIHREDGEDGYGFPVTAFKAATTGAARFYDKSVTMTALRQFLFMRGVLTKADPQGAGVRVPLNSESWAVMNTTQRVMTGGTISLCIDLGKLLNIRAHSYMDDRMRREGGGR